MLPNTNQYSRAISQLDLAACAVLNEDLPALVLVNDERVTSHFDGSFPTVTLNMAHGPPLANIFAAGGEVEVWNLWRGNTSDRTSGSHVKLFGRVEYDHPDFSKAVAAVLERVVGHYYRTRG